MGKNTQIPSFLHTLYTELGLFYDHYFDQLTLSDQPTGALDLTAFLDEKAKCWIDTGTRPIQKKKTLIVNSGFFRFLSPKDQRLINQFFAQLKRFGFIVYIPSTASPQTSSSSHHNESIHLRELNPGALDFLTLTPISSPEALALAASLNLPKDRIQLVNNQFLGVLRHTLKKNYLFNSNLPKKNSTFMSPYLPLNFDLILSDQDALLKILEPDDLFFGAIVVDNSNHLQQLRKELLNRIKHVYVGFTDFDSGTTLRRLNHAELIYADRKENIPAQFYDKKIIIYTNANIKALVRTPHVFDSVYAMKMELNPPCNDNSAVLSLIWTPCIHPLHISPAVIAQYSQLDQLIITQSRLDIDDFNTLLRAAPTITTLKIDYYEIIRHDESNELSIPPDACPYLTTLTITAPGTKLRPSEFVSLLSAAPNLTHLILDGWDWHDLPEIDNARLFNNLISLHFINYQFPSLIHILRLTPNLRSLTLERHSPNQCNEDFIAIPMLLNLQQLKVKRECDNIKDLARLIVKAPHLRSLNTGSIIGIALDQLWNEAIFDELRYLAVNLEIQPPSLVRFFQKAPKLQHTNIKCFKINDELLYALQDQSALLLRLLSSVSEIYIDQNFPKQSKYFSIFHHHRFKKIESLVINNTMLTCTALETLLSALPNIESIHFYKVTFDDTRLNIMPGHLKSLKRIEWREFNSPIKALPLVTLIAAAPNLSRVSILYTHMQDQLKGEFCAKFPNIQFIFKNYSRPNAIPSRLLQSSITRAHIKPDGKLNNEGRTQFTTQTIFTNRNLPSPPTETYHLRCYTWSPINQSFEMYQANPAQLILQQGATNSPLQLSQRYFNDERYLDPSFHLGQIDDLNLEPNQSSLLPALGASDTLIDYACSEPSVTISKDPKTGYHWVQSSTFLLHAKLVFIIKHKKTPTIENSWYWMEDKDQQLIKQLSFVDGALQRNNAYKQLQKLDSRRLLNALSRFCRFPDYNGNDFNHQNTSDLLNYLLLHRIGACRHRAWLFTALAQQFGLNTLYIANDCHSFSVVIDSKGPYLIDLGGAPGQVKALPVKPIVENETIVRPKAETSTKTTKAISSVETATSSKPGSTNLDALFSIWNSCPLAADTPAALAQEMIHHHTAIRHHLLIIPDTNALEVLYHQVLSLRQDNVFFTPHLDAITCRAHAIHEGGIHTNDSPLTQYIKRAQAHPETRFVWFINFSDSKVEHIGYNQLFADQNRRLNDLFLPDNLRLIMIMDKASSRQIPDDLLSCLDAMSYPEQIVWGNALSWHLIEKSVEPGDVLITHEENWKASLLGHIQFNNQMMSWHAGSLYQLSEHQTLTLHNAPLSNRDFRLFMIALDAEGRFFNNGAWHTLPAGISLQYSNSRFEERPILVNQTPIETTRPLNNTHWRYLLAHEYIDTNTHFFKTHPGLLSHEPCRLILTETISDYVAHQLVEEAQARAYPLQIQALPDIKLPIPFKPYALPSSLLIPDDNIQIKLGEDLDFILDGLTGHTIPINETTSFDSLFLRVTRQGNEFLCDETSLLKRLREQHEVILHGVFSPTLIKRLQTLFVHPPHLFINGEQIMVQGTVTLVSNDESLFKGLSYQRIDYDPTFDFHKLPESEQTIRQALYEELALTPCHAHFRYFQHNPQALRLAAGLQSPIDKEYKAITADFLLNALNQQPFLFLIGPSGTGKSELFLRGLPNYARQNNLPLQIHHGLETIMDWIHQETGLAILFDDETNCKNKSLSPFYHLARGEFIIWLDGWCYPLDPLRHRVVCAGNYMQFEGRIEDDLLRRFPHYLEIKPSLRMLDELLRPLLFPFQAQDFMLEQLKDYYQQALQSGLIITPRNAMMILMTAFSLKQLPMLHHLSDEACLIYAISQEIKGLYHQTDSGKALLHSLDANSNQFKQALQSLPMPALGDDFVLTHAHQEIALTLYRLLLIRENKINGTYAQHQGINGYLLEGPPGTGKSNILCRLLNAWDIPYIEISLTDRQLAQQQLDDGFHRGLLVLFDEINGLAIELLLNTYLSGTDMKGNPPQKPGFMILAMQKPIWVSNRQPLSDALANRFSVIKLSSYTETELDLIATTAYQLPTQTSQRLIDSFKQMQDKARREGLPMPGDRRFFKAAQSLCNQPGTSEQSLVPMPIETNPITPEPLQDLVVIPELIESNSLIIRHWPALLGSTLGTAISLSLIGAGLGIGLSITTSIPSFGLSLLASPVIIPILATAGFTLGAVISFTIALIVLARRPEQNVRHLEQDDEPRQNNDPILYQ